MNARGGAIPALFLARGSTRAAPRFIAAYVLAVSNRLHGRIIVYTKEGAERAASFYESEVDASE